MDRLRPIIGAELFAVACGNNVRRTGKVTHKPTYAGVVTKVGRKYFTLSITYSEGEDSCFEERFIISNWQHYTGGYSAGYYLFKDRAEYEDAKEATLWENSFRSRFNSFGHARYTLDQYRKAAAILGLEITN